MHTTGQRRWACAAGVVASLVVGPRGAGATDERLEARHGVRGVALNEVEVGGQRTAWSALETPRSPGPTELRWTIPAGATDRAIELPVCAGRGPVVLDGVPVAVPDAGPFTLPLSPGEHSLSLRVTVSTYERRIACGGPARLGPVEPVREGLLRFAFASPHPGGGHAVLFVPPGHDRAKPSALLLMLHPWNGSVWTYGAYAQLLDEAAKRDVVLLFPSGLGNSLYTAPAEDEARRSLDALAGQLSIDPARVSIAGASMGGAGATTIGLHSPDRFATITSFFGDAKYDLGSYVKAILRDEAGAHRVNALDVADNARNVSVWLIHGEEDRVSPIAQSEILARALEQRGFTVRFDRVPGMGHAGALLAKYARELVATASAAHTPEHPARVTYRSVRTEDRGAYGVSIERSRPGDAFVDIERTKEGTLVVHAAENVTAIALAPGALGAQPGTNVAFDPAGRGVRVAWGAAPSRDP